jgi:hypothetical protein
MLRGDALEHAKKLLKQVPATPASYHGEVLALTWGDRFRIQIWLSLVEPFVGKEAAALKGFMRSVPLE